MQTKRNQMKNDLLVDQARENSVITKFFYDLLNSKRPNWKTTTDRERITYLLRYYAGLSFFVLGNLYHSFISWVTAYYPFSLLYKDRLFHHDNLKVRELMVKIEKIAKKEGINTLVLSGGIEGEMAELIGYLDKGIRNRQKVLDNLETTLQKVYDTVYVRGQGDEFRILIPVESFQKIINHG